MSEAERETLKPPVRETCARCLKPTYRYDVFTNLVTTLNALVSYAICVQCQTLLIGYGQLAFKQLYLNAFAAAIERNLRNHPRIQILREQKEGQDNG